jgi:hypothetical protein
MMLLGYGSICVADEICTLQGPMDPYPTRLPAAFVISKPSNGASSVEDIEDSSIPDHLPLFGVRKEG